jgi:hypothetical protein
MAQSAFYKVVIPGATAHTKHSACEFCELGRIAILCQDENMLESIPEIE